MGADAVRHCARLTSVRFATTLPAAPPQLLPLQDQKGSLRSDGGSKLRRLTMAPLQPPQPPCSSLPPFPGAALRFLLRCCCLTDSWRCASAPEAATARAATFVAASTTTPQPDAAALSSAVHVGQRRMLELLLPSSPWPTLAACMRCWAPSQRPPSSPSTLAHATSAVPPRLRAKSSPTPCRSLRSAPAAPKGRTTTA
jgi:hypothetical protein